MRRRRKERLGGGRGDEKGEKLDGRKNESNKAKTKKFFILSFLTDVRVTNFMPRF